ncbi:unnamed protein product, partial [Urochloa humidicola]
HSLDELKAQRQYATDLEKQIEALAQKLQSVDAQYKQKVFCSSYGICLLPC